jgi:hypothetical protein
MDTEDSLGRSRSGRKTEAMLERESAAQRQVNWFCAIVGYVYIVLLVLEVSRTVA